MSVKALATAAAVLILGAGSAHAFVYHFAATLKGSNETPRVDTSARGELSAVLYRDKKLLTYSVKYTGLSGPGLVARFDVADGRSPGAPAVQPVSIDANPTAGSATLTSDQISDLMAGRWFLHVQTTGHPAGEIGGRVVRHDD
jgi:hypothetical protein